MAHSATSAVSTASRRPSASASTTARSRTCCSSAEAYPSRALSGAAIAASTSSSCRSPSRPGGSRDDRQRLLVQPDRIGVGEHARGDVGGPPVILQRPRRPAAAGVLLGQLGGHRVGVTRVQQFQALGHAAGAAATASAG